MSTGKSQGAPPSPAMGGMLQGPLLLTRGKDGEKGPCDGAFLSPRAVPSSSLVLWMPVRQLRSGSAPMMAPWVLLLAVPFFFQLPLL